MVPYSSIVATKVFQWYQDHNKGHYGLGDLNMPNKKNTYKTNKQPSL
jgi:hypothetical protein